MQFHFKALKIKFYRIFNAKKKSYENISVKKAG